MYKLLRARDNLYLKALHVDNREWCQALPLDEPPPQPIVIEFERDEPRPLDFYWALTPVMSDALIAALGPSELAVYPAAITWKDNAGPPRTGWNAVNVLVEVSLARFVLELPAAELEALDRFGKPKLETLRPALAARAPTLTGPTPPVARLAEWNRPLVIRTDLVDKLAGFSNLVFPDVLRAGEFTGTDISSYLEQAVEPQPRPPRRKKAAAPSTT